MVISPLNYYLTPVLTCVTGSMEPAFRRGDILFLWMQYEQFAVGDIVVFKIDQREIPIVHRVHRVYVVCNEMQLFTRCALSMKECLTYVAGTSNPAKRW